jgi:hypothetical protein
MISRPANILMILALLAVPALMRAQINAPGRVHLAVGLSAAGHGTEYTVKTTILGIPIQRTTSDGAATVTFPIEVGVGVAKVASLGIFIEPGSYLDSSATESNGLASIGFQPRFYVVNKDRFAFMASLRLGASALQIDRNEPNERSQARYQGGHFGLGTGVAFHFSDLFGLQLHLNYLANEFELREYTANGTAIALDNYKAELSTRGLALQASLALRF